MRIGIIGPGRLGRSLAILVDSAGWTAHLTGRGQAPADDVDVRLLTVPDAALAEVATSLARGPVVLHCSGAATVDVLRPHHPAGSLHPLMTFPGPSVGLPDLHGVPAAIDGDPVARLMAARIATGLGLTPLDVPGDRRLYHAAAVIAGNFSTVLLADAARVLAAAGVDPAQAPALLAPLALRSVVNAASDPRGALTGPVARGDEPTIAGHRAALTEAGLHELAKLYDVLSVRTQRLVDPEP